MTTFTAQRKSLEVHFLVNMQLDIVLFHLLKNTVYINQRLIEYK